MFNTFCPQQGTALASAQLLIGSNWGMLHSSICVLSNAVLATTMILFLWESSPA
jgi:hypothetical protein